MQKAHILVLAIAATTPLSAASQTKNNAQKSGSAPDALKALKDKDAAVRYKAVSLLGKLGKTGSFMMPHVRKMLNDPHPLVRVKVVETLWKVEKTPPQILLPVLKNAFKEKQPRVRAGALYVIQQMGRDSAPLLAEVMVSLGDKEFSVQLQAVMAVAALGPIAKPAIPDLLQILRTDKTGFLEANVTVALSKIGTRAVTPLSKALSDKNAKVRRGAAFSLGLLGRKAKRAVPELTKALGDKEDLVRAFSAQALGRVGPNAETAAPALRKCLSDKNPSVQLSAALSLWQIAEDRKGIDVLAKILTDTDTARFRNDAASALADIGPAAAKAMPALVTMLKDKKATVREKGVFALGKIGPPAKSAIEAVEGMLDDKDDIVQINAALAIWRINKTVNKDGFGVIALGLKNKYASTKILSLNVLEEMGPQAKYLLPLVFPMTREQDLSIRDAARKAAKMIDPKLAAQAGIK